MNSQDTLKNIAVRNADALVEKIGWFATVQKLFAVYDTLSGIKGEPGTDRQLVVFMLEHLGYSKCDVGGWILNKN